MKFLYWNTNNINTLDEIIDLLSQEKPHIFFLSEISELTLNDNITNLETIGYKLLLNPGCLRVRIIYKIDIDLELGIQNKYFTHVKLSEQNAHIISLHLPSQMFQHMDSLKEFIRDFRNKIDTNIGSPEEQNIIIIGDFNVNPFEKPMIDFDGFSATNSIKSRKKITHLGKQKSLYYNPTWKLYNNNDFPGTKYFRRPSASSYDIIEHHFLDQVVISPKLLEIISNEDIKVITQSSKYKYFSNEINSILISDHLPLSYEIKF